MQMSQGAMRALMAYHVARQRAPARERRRARRRAERGPEARSTSPICRRRCRRRPQADGDAVRRFPRRRPRPPGIWPRSSATSSSARSSAPAATATRRPTAAHQAHDAGREAEAAGSWSTRLMPPRFAYWTILAGGLPTAFRAAEREELLPTFKRLREKHPDAEMKWFARGKLWDSPEEAKRPLGPQSVGRGRSEGRSRSADKPGPPNAKREARLASRWRASRPATDVRKTPRRRETALITESAGSSVSTAIHDTSCAPPVSRTGHPARTPGATVRPPAPRAAGRPSPIAATRPRPIGAIVIGPAVTAGRAPPSVEGRSLATHARTRGATPARRPQGGGAPFPIAAARPRPIGAIVTGPRARGRARRPRGGPHRPPRRLDAGRPPAGQEGGHPPDRRGAPKADWRDRDRPRGDAGRARPSVEAGGHHGRTRGATVRRRPQGWRCILPRSRRRAQGRLARS